MLLDVQIPKEAKWITQDKDGQWFWWNEDTPPRPNKTLWDNENAQEDYNCGLLAEGAPPENWKEEIYEIIFK